MPSSDYPRCHQPGNASTASAPMLKSNGSPSCASAPCATSATNCLAGERKASFKAKSPSSNAFCATALAP